MLGAKKQCQKQCQMWEQKRDRKELVYEPRQMKIITADGLIWVLRLKEEKMMI